MSRKLYYSAEVYHRDGRLVYSHPFFQAERRDLGHEHAIYCAYVDTGFPLYDLWAKLTPTTKDGDPGTQPVVHCKR